MKLSNDQKTASTVIGLCRAALNLLDMAEGTITKDDDASLSQAIHGLKAIVDSVPSEDIPANPEFFRTLMLIETVSKGPYDPKTLENVHYDISQGDLSGAWNIIESQGLTKRETVVALQDQGSDADFLLDEEDVFAYTLEPGEKVQYDSATRIIETIDFRGDKIHIKFAYGEEVTVTVDELEVPS